MTHVVITAVIPFHLLAALVPLSLAVCYLRPGAWYLMLALAAGAVIGFVDLHTDEAVLPATLLLLFGALLGTARPSRAWIWALVLAVWVPAGHAALHWAGDPRAGAEGTPAGPLLAFVFAFAGCYAGAGVSALTGRRRSGGGRGAAG